MLLFFLVFGLEGIWPAKNGGIYANFGRQDWFFQLFLRITEPQNYVCDHLQSTTNAPNSQRFFADLNQPLHRIKLSIDALSQIL